MYVTIIAAITDTGTDNSSSWLILTYKDMVFTVNGSNCSTNTFESGVNAASVDDT